ncbi:LuxR C-terminal-related transcriptional regulator [Streptomyces chartreusis]|uniref:LuxR C-terminal-related transcriptional regulator n=1 Tax=Streptomyces chartreusis TaxID=1969 RepID=UPI0036C92EA3
MKSAQLLAPVHDFLTGNGHVLQVLKHGLVAAADGLGGMQVVAAGAGAGKTALLAAAVRQGRELGFTVLSDKAAYRDLTPPFGVAARMMGMNGEDYPTEMAQLHHRLDQLVAAGPVLIVVDDCQWLDRETVEWLCSLAGRGGSRTLAVVVAVSLGEPSRDPELIEELQALSTRPLHLPALDEEATAQLLARWIGTKPDASFTAQCTHLTSGNPLLLTLLAGAVLEQGIQPTDGNAEVLLSTGVSALTPILRSRLRRISPHGLTVAEMLAVLGNAGTCDQITELTGLSSVVVADTIRQLADAGLVARDLKTARLAHELCRLQLGRGIPHAALQSIHAQAAQLMTRGNAPAEQVAKHLLAAPAVGDAWAAAVLQAAAEDAVRHNDYTTAASYLARLIIEPLPADLRTEALLTLAEVEVHNGGQSALEPIAAALALPLTDTDRSRALTALVDARHLTGADDQPPAVDGPDALVAELYMQHATTAADGIRLLKRTGEPGELDDDTRLLSLVSQYVAWSGRSPEHAKELARRVLAAPGTAGTVAGLRAIEVLTDTGETDAAWRAAEDAVSIAHKSHRGLHTVALAVRSALYHRLGKLSAAVADAQAALDASAQSRCSQVRCKALLVDALIDIGDLDAAKTALYVAEGRDRALPDTFAGVMLRYSRGRLAIASGNPEAGINHLESCAEQLVVWQAHNWSGLPWRGELVNGLLAADRRAEAIDLAEEDLARSRDWGVSGAVGRALRGRGTANQGSAGLADLRLSVEILDTSPWQLERARSHVAYGSALATAGHRAEARDVLRLGHQLAERCGATALAELARRAHRSVGGRLGRRAADPISLSPAESRVAALVAENMTNAQIARTLSVGVRTVEAHLTQCYRKLSVQGRAGLIETLHRNALL